MTGGDFTRGQLLAAMQKMGDEFPESIVIITADGHTLPVLETAMAMHNTRERNAREFQAIGAALEETAKGAAAAMRMVTRQFNTMRHDEPSNPTPQQRKQRHAEHLQKIHTSTHTRRHRRR